MARVRKNTDQNTQAAEDAAAKKRSESAKKAAETRKRKAEEKAAAEAAKQAETEQQAAPEVETAPETGGDATEQVEDTQAASDSDEVAALKAKLAAAEAENAAMKAQNNPVEISPETHTDELDAPSLDSVGFERDGAGNLQKVGGTNADEIEIFNNGSQDTYESLKFLEEPVTIMIQETSEPDGSNPVFLAVNGQPALGVNGPWVPRNQLVTVKRKFVEVLLRAKRTDYTMREIIEDGERKIVNDARIKLQYPFSVDKDANPNGRAWLQHLMAEL